MANYTYTCDSCGTTSRGASSEAELKQQQETHTQVRHSSVTRNGAGERRGQSGGTVRRGRGRS